MRVDRRITEVFGDQFRDFEINSWLWASNAFIQVERALLLEDN
jgi:hypothetical protein